MQGRGLGGSVRSGGWGGPGGSRQWGWCMAGGEVWDGGHASALSALNENEKGTGHKLEMQGGEGRRGQRCGRRLEAGQRGTWSELAKQGLAQPAGATLRTGRVQRLSPGHAACLKGNETGARLGEQECGAWGEEEEVCSPPCFPARVPGSSSQAGRLGLGSLPSPGWCPYTERVGLTFNLADRQEPLDT